jgi:hypothetical protein
MKPYDPADLASVVEEACERCGGRTTYFSQLTTPSREAGVGVPGRALVPR